MPRGASRAPGWPDHPHRPELRHLRIPLLPRGQVAPLRPARQGARFCEPRFAEPGAACTHRAPADCRARGVAGGGLKGTRPGGSASPRSVPGHAPDDGIDAQSARSRLHRRRAGPGDAVVTDTDDDARRAPRAHAVRLGSGPVDLGEHRVARRRRPDSLRREIRAWLEQRRPVRSHLAIPWKVRAGNSGCSLPDSRWSKHASIPLRSCAFCAAVSRVDQGARVATGRAYVVAGAVASAFRPEHR